MVQIAFEQAMRKYVPIMNKLGQSPIVGDQTSLKHLKDHKLSLVRTKGEMIREYSHWMRKVHKNFTIAVLSGLVAFEFGFEILNGNITSFTVAGITIATAFAMYKWWRSGADYSNWQQFEMRPMLMPIEDAGMWDK